MPEVLQRALNPAGAPTRILTGHSDRECPDLLEDAGATGTSRHAGQFAGNRGPVPSEDRVRRHERGHLGQDTSPQSVALGRESTPLVIGQPETPPAQLLFEDAVLLPHVVDDFQLMAIHPAREGDKEDAQPDSGNHGPSVLG